MYDTDVTRRRATERTIIEEARIAGGLTQSELAERWDVPADGLGVRARHEVTQPGCDHAATPGVRVESRPPAAGVVHRVPSAGGVPVPDEDNDKRWWDLSVRADRKRVYERLLTYADEAHLMLYLDGALLVDLWDELRVPDPMWGLWEPIIEANRRAPARPDRDYYCRNGETWRSPIKVVRHAGDR